MREEGRREEGRRGGDEIGGQERRGGERRGGEEGREGREGEENGGEEGRGGEGRGEGRGEKGRGGGRRGKITNYTLNLKAPGYRNIHTYMEGFHERQLVPVLQLTMNWEQRDGTNIDTIPWNRPGS